MIENTGELVSVHRLSTRVSHVLPRYALTALSRINGLAGHGIDGTSTTRPTCTHPPCSTRVPAGAGGKTARAQPAGNPLTRLLSENLGAWKFFRAGIFGAALFAGGAASAQEACSSDRPHARLLIDASGPTVCRMASECLGGVLACRGDGVCYRETVLGCFSCEPYPRVRVCLSSDELREALKRTGG